MASKRRTDWGLIILGLLYIVISALMFTNVLGTDVAIAMCAGIVFLVTGLARIILYIKAKKIKAPWAKWRLLQGILDIVVGIIFLTDSLAAAYAVNIVLGISIMVYGLIMFFSSFNKEVRKTYPWGLLFVVGILLFAVGLAITFKGWGLVIMPIMLGLWMLICGVRDIANGIKGHDMSNTNIASKN